MNLDQAVENAHKRLEDISTGRARWFDRDRLKRYFLQGLQSLVLEASLMLDFMMLDDFPNASNSDFPWEGDFLFSFRRVVSGTGGLRPPRQIIDEIGIRFGGSGCQFDYLWEQDYIVSGGTGPSNFDYPWEAEMIDTCGLNQERRPILDLPEHVYGIDRVTFDSYVLISIPPSTLQVNVTNQISVGIPRAYTILQDDMRHMRVYPMPASTAQYVPDNYFGILRGTIDVTPDVGIHMHIDQFGAVIGGVLDQPPGVFWDMYAGVLLVSNPGSTTNWGGDFAAYEVSGREGTLRNLSGFDPSFQFYGVPRRISPEATTTKLEYWRKPDTSVSDLSSPMPVPDMYSRYAIFYAMARALMDDGPAQNLKLSQHYMLRYKSGQLRVKDRKQKSERLRMMVMSDAGNVLHRRDRAVSPDVVGPMMDQGAYVRPFIKTWRRR